MRAFQLLVVGIWVALLLVTWRAVDGLGLGGGTVFVSDLSHPWRAQFNVDFLLHLLLFALWVFWREQSKRIGIVCAVLCIFGGLFTFPYLLVAALHARGDFRALLLGAHARSRPIAIAD
jgi:hypothetical protein